MRHCESTLGAGSDIPDTSAAHWHACSHCFKFDHLLPAISGISVHLIWNGPLEHPLDELALRRVSQERMRYKRVHHVPRFDSDRHATERYHERNEMYKLVVSATSVVDLRTLIHTGTVATCVLSAFGRLGMKTGGFWLP